MTRRMARSRQKVGQGREILLAEHGAGRVGGAGQHEAVQRPVDGRELPGRGLEAGRGVDRDRHHLDVERPQDVAVGRIARHRHGDPVAGIEGGEEAQDEGARGAGRDRDAGRDRPPARTTRHSGGRCGAAGPAGPGPRCSRAGPRAAPPRRRPAPRGGAPLPGSPTSRWRTSAPCAARSFAALSTSMTMKGGTSPRRDVRPLICYPSVPVPPGRVCRAGASSGSTHG